VLERHVPHPYPPPLLCSWCLEEWRGDAATGAYYARATTRLEGLLFDAHAELVACREQAEWLMQQEADCRAAITEALAALDREQKARAELTGLLQRAERKLRDACEELDYLDVRGESSERRLIEEMADEIGAALTDG
jgi:chromosome segregation ATPase